MSKSMYIEGMYLLRDPVHRVKEPPVSYAIHTIQLTRSEDYCLLTLFENGSHCRIMSVQSCDLRGQR